MVSHLPLMDSFIREVHRLYPTLSSSITHLSDGVLRD